MNMSVHTSADRVTVPSSLAGASPTLTVSIEQQLEPHLQICLEI